QRDYYAEWEKLISNRVSREEDNWQKIPAHAMRIQKDAERAAAVANDSRRRLRELTTSGNSITDDAITALREVIEAAEQEEQDTRSLLAMLENERKQSTA